MKNTVLKQIVRAVVARQNCIKSNNTEWLHKWEEILNKLESILPRGSGFDNGTKIDLDRSQQNRIYLVTAFHHMNEGGYYDGWTQHDVIITPDLLFDFKLSIHGRNKNQIKEYIAEEFELILSKETEVV